jgi:hypothetical protein
LLRGQGYFGKEPGYIGVELERVVEWDGVDTASADAR